MRELTSIEIRAINGGVDGEPTLGSQFWGSFMYSSGFASGIFWSPVMPFIMGTSALISILASGLAAAVIATGNAVSYTATSVASVVSKQSTTP